MVKVHDPGYPIAGEGMLLGKTFFILAASAGKEFDETNTIAFEGPLADKFITLPVQSLLKYFLTKATWLNPCSIDALSITLLIFIEALMASSTKEHQAS